MWGVTCYGGGDWLRSDLPGLKDDEILPPRKTFMAKSKGQVIQSEVKGRKETIPNIKNKMQMVRA